MAVVGPVNSKRAGIVHLAHHVDVTRRPLLKDGDDLDPLDDLPVALVQFGLELGQGQPLGLDRADRRQRDGALGGDAGELALAADARPAIHRRPQVFQLRVHLQRRDRDSRNFVVLPIFLLERIAELGHREPRGVDLAQQPQGDRAVRLQEQVAVDLRIGERFHLNLIADVQAVGRGSLLPRQAIGHVELIVDPQAILGHVGQPGVSDVFALGVGLPLAHAARLPAAPVAATGGTIHTADVARRGGTQRLAQENAMSLLRGC